MTCQPIRWRHWVATEAVPAPSTAGYGYGPHRAPATTTPAPVQRSSQPSCPRARHHHRHRSSREVRHATPPCSSVARRPTRSHCPGDTTEQQKQAAPRRGRSPPTRTPTPSTPPGAEDRTCRPGQQRDPPDQRVIVRAAVTEAARESFATVKMPRLDIVIAAIVTAPDPRHDEGGDAVGPARPSVLATAHRPVVPKGRRGCRPFGTTFVEVKGQCSGR